MDNAIGLLVEDVEMSHFSALGEIQEKRFCYSIDHEIKLMLLLSGMVGGINNDGLSELLQK